VALSQKRSRWQHLIKIVAFAREPSRHRKKPLRTAFFHVEWLKFSGENRAHPQLVDSWGWRIGAGENDSTSIFLHDLISGKCVIYLI
jgi:hypothetical protein